MLQYTKEGGVEMKNLMSKILSMLITICLVGGTQFLPITNNVAKANGKESAELYLQFYALVDLISISSIKDDNPEFGSDNPVGHLGYNSLVELKAFLPSFYKSICDTHRVFFPRCHFSGGYFSTLLDNNGLLETLNDALFFKKLDDGELDEMLKDAILVLQRIFKNDNLMLMPHPVVTNACMKLLYSEIYSTMELFIFRNFGLQVSEFEFVPKLEGFGVEILRLPQVPPEPVSDI